MTSVSRRTAIVLALLLLATISMRAQSAPGAMPLQGTPATPGAPPPAPVQPLPYSHKKHLALGLSCRNCHVNPDAGKLMMYPATATCMTCHRTVAADRPAIQKLAAFAASDAPIPWARVYQVPDYVYWKHATHLEANVTCIDCHGPVAERDVIARETNITTMVGCLSCHNTRQVYTDCGDCHAPRQ